MHDDLTLASTEQSEDDTSDAKGGDASPPRNSFAPGVLVAGKYTVERVVGEGGIGIVVAARHVELDQVVAIKYLRPKALASANAADRFSARPASPPGFDPSTSSASTT